MNLRHIFERRLVLIPAGFVGLLLLVLYLATRPSADLKAWKAMMVARGERFALAELVPPFSPEAAAWQSNLSHAAQGLVRNPNPGLLLLAEPKGNRAAAPVWQRPDPFGVATPQNFWPLFMAAMRSNETAIAEIRRLMGARPAGTVFDLGSRVQGRHLIDLVGLRLVAQGLSGHAIAALREGRVEAAERDLSALILFAGSVDPGGVLIDLAIHSAIGQLALGLTAEFGQVPSLTEAQLAEFQEQWQRFNFITNASAAIERERASSASLFEFSRTNAPGVPGAMTGPGQGTPPVAAVLNEALVHRFWRRAWSEGDEHLFLRVLQPVIEGLRAARTNDSFAGMQARQRESRALCDAETGGFLGRLRRPLTLVAVPNWDKLFVSLWRNDSLRRVTVCALALRRHQLRHGRLPDSLVALVPEFLPAVPTDPMATVPGQALQYRLLPDGRFLLYAVGANGVDDGGGGDDIAWPQAAPVTAAEE